MAVTERPKQTKGDMEKDHLEKSEQEKPIPGYSTLNSRRERKMESPLAID